MNKFALGRPAAGRDVRGAGDQYHDGAGRVVEHLDHDRALPVLRLRPAA